MKGSLEKAVPVLALVVGGLGFLWSSTPLIIAGVLLAALFVALNVASLGWPTTSRRTRR
jgi:hypothetical protein